MSAILVSARPAVVPLHGRPASERRGGRSGERHLRLVQPAGPGTETGSEPSSTRRLRLTRRGRLVVATLALLLVGGAGLWGSRAAADGPRSAPVVERHVVAPGETLWGIAAHVARPGQDVRDVVVELKALNDLSDSGLTAGEELVVPTAG